MIIQQQHETKKTFYRTIVELKLQHGVDCVDGVNLLSYHCGIEIEIVSSGFWFYCPFYRTIVELKYGTSW